MNKKKIGVVDIKGGFGNQLFQIALAKYLTDNNFDIYINTRNFQRSKSIKNLNVDLRELILPLSLFDMREIPDYRFKFLEIIQKIDNQSIVKKITGHNFEISKLRKINRFDGYWQNQLYFNHSKNFLLTSLAKNQTIKKGLEEKNQAGSTMLHVRRGDYTSLQECLSVGYYEKALFMAKENIENFSFSVFTDDIAWVKKHEIFQSAENIYHSSNSKEDTLIAFSQMLQFQNFITANSTFSLTAALLSQNKNTKIFIPNPWFRNSPKKIDFPSTIKIENKKT